MLCRLVILALLIACFASIVGAGVCPCSDSPIEYRSLAKEHALCIYFEKELESQENLIKRTKQFTTEAGLAAGISVHFVGENTEQTFGSAGCNVLFRLRRHSERSLTSHYMRSICPGKCEAIPELRLPVSWFVDSAVEMDRSEDINLSCSLSLLQFLRRHSIVSIDRVPLELLLRELYWRRIQECYEQKHWAKPLASARGASAATTQKQQMKKSNNSSTVFDVDRRTLIGIRRTVESVVIWVGSNSTASRNLVAHQSQTLLGQPFEGREAVVGWGADDTLYPCRVNSHKCPGGHSGNKKYKYLPASAVDAMGAGWACAQRRPLRALAHVLVLYDPTFIILVDDDTYVNYPLILHRYVSFLSFLLVLLNFTLSLSLFLSALLSPTF